MIERDRSFFQFLPAHDEGERGILFTGHDAKMYSRFGRVACLKMAVVTGGCCSVVLAASNEESSDSVQWAYPSPYDDEDKEEEDAERTFYVLRRLELSLYMYQIYRKIR